MRLTPSKRNNHYHAIHEASHAILCYMELGTVPDSIRISDTGGRSDFSSSISIPAKSYLMITVSGAIGTRLFGYNNPSISELAFNPKRNSDKDWGWLKCDYEQAIERYKQEEDLCHALRKIETMVQKKLKLKWKKLIELTEILTNEHELNKKQILKIVKTA